MDIFLLCSWFCIRKCKILQAVSTDISSFSCDFKSLPCRDLTGEQAQYDHEDSINIALDLQPLGYGTPGTNYGMGMLQH
jgi:hypothetical protein